MEKKLKKQLQAKAPWLEEDNTFEPGNFSARALKGENLVLAYPAALDTVQRLKLCLDLVRRALQTVQSDDQIWLVLSSNAPQPFKEFWIHNAFPQESIQINAPWCRDFENQDKQTRLRVWCPEEFSLSRSRDISSPKLVIFEGLEGLGLSRPGPELESGLLLLPPNIPLIGLLSANYSDFPYPPSTKNDLELFHRLWTREELNLTAEEPPLLFLGSEGDFFPLLDRKKVATRVKRLMRESSEFNFPAPDGKFSGFLQRLIAALRREQLTPAYIVLPHAEDCERGISLCSEVKSKAPASSTAAGIAPLLDINPSMKNERLQEILSKQVGALKPGDHPEWLQLIQTLFSLKIIDVLFFPPQGLDLVCSKAQSFVWTTTQGINPHSQFTVHEINQGRQSVFSVNQELKGCLIGCYTNQVDMVQLKDSYLQKIAGLSSRLVPTPYLILCLSLSDADLRDSILDHSWLGNQIEFAFPEQMGEICRKIREILPNAECATVSSALALQNISFELSLALEKLSSNREPKEETQAENINRLRERLQLKHSLLPCLQCAHDSDCRRGGYKKLRDLFHEYNIFQTRFPHHIDLLDHELEQIVLSLQHCGFLDQAGRVTKLGRTALQSGLNYPFVFIRCLHNNLFTGIEDKKAPSVAAMLLEQSEIPLFPAIEPAPGSHLEALAQRIVNLYSEAQSELFRFGLLLPDPSPGRGALLERLPEGKHYDVLQHYSQHYRLQPGSLLALRTKSERLVQRFADTRTGCLFFSATANP